MNQETGMEQIKIIYARFANGSLIPEGSNYDPPKPHIGIVENIQAKTDIACKKMGLLKFVWKTKKIVHVILRPCQRQALCIIDILLCSGLVINLIHLRLILRNLFMNNWINMMNLNGKLIIIL
jgi:hypothetical protein